MISRRSIPRLLAGLLGSLMVLSASAQGFPNKMVTVMVPYPAGGPSDAVARLVQVEYEKNLGQKMMVENLGGVSGALGVQKVLAAPADGYYQLLSTPMELVMAPLALSAVKFKPEEVRMASLMGRTSIGLAVRKDLPVNNLPEFLAWAKGKQVSYARPIEVRPIRLAMRTSSGLNLTADRASGAIRAAGIRSAMGRQTSP